jgi:hypothetical protein
MFRYALGFGLILSGVALAQGPGRTFTHTEDFSYVRTEFGGARAVKGSPYSAQAVTQFTQTLPDGNHIQRTITSSIARDSEGRTRREQNVGSIGALSGSGHAAKSIMIHDPVAKTSTTLDANSKVAQVHHEMQGANFMRHAQPGSGVQAQPMRHQDSGNLKTEDLGTQVMEGLSVQGKRVTHTIPAGTVGNDRDIQTVSETWFSQDLQAVVMSKTTDPRSGVSTYQLTNISRAEPDAALFQVPGDYTVNDAGNGSTGPRMMRRSGPPKQQE